jgi:hypothetical protein
MKPTAIMRRASCSRAVVNCLVDPVDSLVVVSARKIIRGDPWVPKRGPLRRSDASERSGRMAGADIPPLSGQVSGGAYGTRPAEDPAWPAELQQWVQFAGQAVDTCRVATSKSAGTSTALS